MSIPAVGVSNIMLRLAAYRLFLFIFPLIVAIFVFAKTSTSEVEYTAYARLLPPQANNTTATMQIQMPALTPLPPAPLLSALTTA